MRELTILLVIFSPLLMASSCSRRPDTDVFGINVPALKVRGYNLKRDFDDAGNRRPDAKPFEVAFPDAAAMLQYLNKATCTNPVGLQNLKVAIEEARRDCAPRPGD